MCAHNHGNIVTDGMWATTIARMLIEHFFQDAFAFLLLLLRCRDEWNIPIFEIGTAPKCTRTRNIYLAIHVVVNAYNDVNNCCCRRRTLSLLTVTWHDERKIANICERFFFFVQCVHCSLCARHRQVQHTLRNSLAQKRGRKKNGETLSTFENDDDDDNSGSSLNRID